MIYFDLDNTLIDYNSSERKAIEFIFKEKYGLVLNNNQTDYWSKISRKYFDYYLSKQITFEEQGKNRFIKMLSYCGYVENEKIAMELFEEYQKQLENSWILFDDVVDMLHSLEGYRLGIISNGKSIQQRAKLSCTNIEKYFEIILISEETGFAKPSVDIFYEAVKQSGEKIDSVIYVGDNIKTDILPCEKIGMKCVLVDRNSICEKNICKIKNLYEIHNVLLNDIGQYNTELSIRSWMGDLRLQALANYETYQMNDMVKGCLYLFAALPMENGQVGACVFLEPEPEVDDTVMFDYSLLFITALWDYYKHTNDREALEDLWDTVKTQISLGIKQVGEDNVVKDSDIIGWCFLDWSLELNKQAGAQGVLLYAMQSAIAIAKEVGKNREAECLFETYELYRKAARLKFYDENKGLFTSGADKQVSYASQVWMVLGNVIEPEMGLEVLHNVAAEKDAVEMVTPYIYHYYIEALLKCGAKDEALAVMKNYWGGMAELGADTFWELYNPKNPDESPYGGTIVNSYCHAWSCAPAYFLRRYYSEK